MPSTSSHPSDDDARRDTLQALQARCRELEAALEQIEQRDRLLGDSAPFGIFTIDRDGGFAGLNAKMRTILGWTEAPIPPEANAFELAMFRESGLSGDLRRCLETGRAAVKAHPCITGREECLELRFHISPVVNALGTTEGAIVFVEDFSLMKQAAEAVRESDHRYHVLFHSAPVAMIERDASRLKAHLDRLRSEGVQDLEAYLDRHPDEILPCMQLVQTIDFNRAFMNLLEADDRQALSLGMPWGDPEEFRELGREVILMIDGGRIGQEHERVITTLKGNRKTVLSKGLAVTGHEDTLARLVVTLIDISERKAAEEALRESERKFREMALRDTLTGLYNRRFLYQSLPDLIASGRYERSGIGLVFMDLDNFKQIVDRHGHLHGSQVIREVAAVIKAALSPPEFAVAYAGDEFVVVLPGSGLDAAVTTAGDLQGCIRETVYLQQHGLDVRLKASLGVAAYPSQARDAEELLAFADRALFDMKVRGKDGVHGFVK